MNDTNSLRKQFLDFFEAHGHLILPSASLIPESPSTLLTGAGMQPFVPAYRGEVAPPAPCIATCQKCVRAGDIEQVGRTARHHTFFEMLGNFSFGAYFKREAITLAWELMRDGYGIPAEAMWATVYEEDQESFDIWHKVIGLPEERIVRCGKKDNWWPQTAWNGPCGPCTEIHVDQGPERFPCDNPNCGVQCECDRFIEVWNLVFQMYSQTEDGEISDLPRPGVDTGLGLERLAAVKQGVASNFEIDIFKPILRAIEQAAEAQNGGVRYGDNPETDVAIRVIADHIRALTFMIADQILPSNEGRGYVLRRILRRAFKFARLLGISEPFLHTLVPALVSTMGDVYPEIVQRQSLIERVIRQEEQRFCSTLDQGMTRLEELLADLKKRGQTVIPGEEVFRLYDTFGFPWEMTEEIAGEAGMTIDREGFQRELERQRSRSTYQYIESGAEKEFYVKLSRKHPPSEFVRDEGLELNSEIVVVLGDKEELECAQEGDTCAIMLARTPFYAEKGGQVGDTGTLRTPDGAFEVRDTQEPVDGVILHIGQVTSGELRPGDAVTATVDGARRAAIMRAHTATHLLHWALREHLGEHVAQAGSLVEADRLRFDFSHFEAVPPDKLAEIERAINERILEGAPVSAEIMALDEAKAAGAIALFGEKYGQQVRVVSVGDFSKELCGGTHVANTAQIGYFRLLSESGIGATTRRIEALTGLAAVAHARHSEDLLQSVARELNAPPEKVFERLEALQRQIKELRKQIAELRERGAGPDVAKLLEEAQPVAGARLVAADLGELGLEELQAVADRLVERGEDVAAVLAARREGRATLVCKLGRAIVQRGGHAGNLVAELGKIVGGGGGGNPTFARAGGRDVAKIADAVRAAPDLLAAQLGEK